MTKSRLTKLYGMFDSFTEAFTSTFVEHTVEHNVYEEGDTVPLDFYKITFNTHEFMTLSELIEIKNLMRDLLKKNGVDTSKITSGRTDEDLAKADFSLMSVEHI